MAFALPLFFSRILDANSDVLSGGKLYVYDAGTSTPTDFYTTSALSVAHANPLSADSGGLFANCFFAAGDYKLKFTTSAGVTVLEIDNYHVEEEGTQIDFPTVVKTANFTVTAADRGKVFLVDASGGNIAVSADSETLGSGFPFFIADRGASGTTTIAGTGAQTVDGAASVSISNQYSAIGFVSVGAAGWQSIATSDLSAFALLASSNVFTADQTIRSSDAGAAFGPLLILDRNSASPAASDLGAQIIFRGRDSAGNATDYADINLFIIDPTNGSEDGQVTIRTVTAGGALTNQLVAADGVIIGSPTGGDLGVGTINATGIYDDGVLLTPGGSALLGTITTTSGTEQTLGSLVLTSYTFLKLIWRGVSTGGTVSFSVGNSSSDDVVVTQATGGASGAIHGTTEIQLSTGKAITMAAISGTSGTAIGITQDTTALTTASTAVYVNGGGGTFDAGTIDVYGIR